MRGKSRDPLSYPLRCRPLLKPKIWGGRGLATMLGKQLPPGEPVGESWEVADVPQGTSFIADGPLAGMTLHEVMARFGERLFPGWGATQFPIMVKFLDAQDDISIQVHPHAQVCAERFPEERSKNETWVIMHVEPGGAVLHGVHPGVTLDEIRTRINAGTITEVMRRIEVRPGDVLHLPAGTLHALLRGVMLLEVHEPSDSTFRVYDHDRLGLDGRPRELHVEQALATLRLDGNSPALLTPIAERHAWGERELLIDIASYRVERLTQRDELIWRPEEGADVLVVVAGAVELDLAEGHARLGAGETVIVPPDLDVTLAPIGVAQVVVVSPHRPA